MPRGIAASAGPAAWPWRNVSATPGAAEHARLLQSQPSVVLVVGAFAQARIGCPRTLPEAGSYHPMPTLQRPRAGISRATAQRAQGMHFSARAARFCFDHSFCSARPLCECRWLDQAGAPCADPAAAPGGHLEGNGAVVA
eukprot:15475321-Alexandrium_andersonii.AAC.1